MKRMMLCILALAMAACMAACAEPVYDDDPQSNTQPSTEATEPSTTVETTEATTEPETTAARKMAAGLVPESASVTADYFNDVAFVGDSVSLKLTYYESANNVLGDAQFITAGSLGSANALWDLNRSDAVHPVFQGEKRYVWDSVALSGAKKVYIMLGMNDIALYGIDTSVENLTTVIGKILEKSPDVTICIQSMTPIAATSTVLKPNGLCPLNIDSYNAKLLALCEEKGWYFLDVASVMKTTDGYLIPEYCSDGSGLGVHFTSAGCAAWVDYLYKHPID